MAGATGLAARLGHKQATGYAIDPHRKADVLERLIAMDWSGKMVHDGFASYNRFQAGGNSITPRLHGPLGTAL